MGAAAPGDTPWSKRLRDTEDAEIPVEEHGVDREAHEEHVNRRGGADPEPCAYRELFPPEQTLHSRGHGDGQLAALADDSAALPLNPQVKRSAKLALCRGPFRRPS